MVAPHCMLIAYCMRIAPPPPNATDMQLTSASDTCCLPTLATKYTDGKRGTDVGFGRRTLPSACQHNVSGHANIATGTASIPNYGWYNCQDVTTVTIPESVELIGEGAFEQSGLTTVTIPDSVTAIGPNAFQECSRLASVIIGNQVKSIGEYAFYLCTQLTSVIILPTSVTTIGGGAFAQCSSLTSATIPSTVESFEGHIPRGLPFDQAGCCGNMLPFGCQLMYYYPGVNLVNCVVVASSPAISPPTGSPATASTADSTTASTIATTTTGTPISRPTGSPATTGTPIATTGTPIATTGTPIPVPTPRSPKSTSVPQELYIFGLVAIGIAAAVGAGCVLGVQAVKKRKRVTRGGGENRRGRRCGRAAPPPGVCAGDDDALLLLDRPTRNVHEIAMIPLGSSADHVTWAHQEPAPCPASPPARHSGVTGEMAWPGGLHAITTSGAVALWPPITLETTVGTAANLAPAHLGAPWLLGAQADIVTKALHPPTTLPAAAVVGHSAPLPIEDIWQTIDALLDLERSSDAGDEEAPKNNNLCQLAPALALGPMLVPPAPVLAQHSAASGASTVAALPSKMETMIDAALNPAPAHHLVHSLLDTAALPPATALPALSAAAMEERHTLSSERLAATVEVKVADRGKADPATAVAKLARAQKRKKYKNMETVSAEDWHESVQHACWTGFHRLTLESDPGLRDGILKRIHRGARADGQPYAPRCFLVKRDDPASKSLIQLQVHGARLLVQKALYTGYHHLPPEEMTTWQVQQHCARSDGSWWCFEPSHLVKRFPKQKQPGGPALPIPGEPDAVYIARPKVSQGGHIA